MHKDEKWFLKSRKGDANRLSASLGVSSALSTILINRQIDSKKIALSFLHPDLLDLHDPFLLNGMDKAVGIIIDAIDKKKKIMLIGDYDVDGVMGLLLLINVLSRYCPDIDHYIPHRVEDGYGLNSAIIEKSHESGVDLIITCDNGVSSFEAIGLAKEYGISVIVTDHHDMPYTVDDDGNTVEQMVPADVVVNPKQSCCNYPFKQLCGAGVAYKLAIALFQRLGESVSEEDAKEMIICAAIATICDIVELTDENRVIVHYGLRYINEGIKNIGLRALVEACELSAKTITTFDVGHVLGPCINATGRIDSAEMSFDLFNTQDYSEAQDLAASVREVNRERQDITKEAFDAAVAALALDGEEPGMVIVLYIPGIHVSITGIVAGKLRDKYARPVIILTDSKDDTAKGSGRSIEGYDLFSGLSKQQDILLNYGGHRMAAGMSINKGDVDSFRERMNSGFDSTATDLTPKVLIDLEYPIENVRHELVREISRLEPCGKGNPRPLFAAKGVTIDYAALVGLKRNVVRLKVSSERRKYINAVFFGDSSLFVEVMGLEPDDSGILIANGYEKLVDITYHPEINTYRGLDKIQLVIQNIRLSAK